jgi:FkbM family methyltransferase
MKIFIRDSLARLFRALPSFRGKQKVGLALTSLLTNYDNEPECIVTLKMRDNSIMCIDLRSFERSVFFTGEYDYALIQRLSSILKPGCTVLDVGANIGFYSVALGLKLKKMSGDSNSKIYAIEAVESNFARLKNMIKINELVNIVYPINIALGNRQGEVLFHMTDEGKSTTGNAIWVKENKNLTKMKKGDCMSYMTRLDDFVKTHEIENCELIKVDIEGAEFDFLLGGRDFINKCRPIIFSEFNTCLANKFGYSFIDLSKYMKSQNYKLYQQKGLNNFVFIEELLTNLSNILMIPEERENTNLFEQLGIEK